MRNAKSRRHIHRGPERNKPQSNVQKYQNQQKSLPKNTHYIHAGPLTEKIVNHWYNWSTKQKVAAVLVLLAAAGLSIAAAYYLLPSMLAYFQGVSDEFAKKNYYTPTSVSQSIQNKKYHASKNKDFDNGFFNTTAARNILKTKVSKAKVICDPALKYHVEAMPSKSFKEKMYIAIDKQIEIIKSVLSDTIHPKILLKLIEDPTFSIQISHRTIINSNGLYLPNENRILVALDFLQDKEFIKNNLKNELHSAGIYVTNVAKQKEKRKPLPQDNLLLAGPYVNNKWEKDKALAKKLDAAISNSETRIRQFINLFINKQKHSPEWEKYLKDIENYQPRVRETRFPDAFSELLFSNLKPSDDANFLNVIPQGILYPAEKPWPIQFDAYVIDILDEKLSGEIMVRYKYAKNNTLEEKIKAFIAEYFEYEWRFSRETTYTKLAANRDAINLEKSSDIEELSPNIPAIIYAEWCDYFSKYLEVENYCEFKNSLTA